MAGAIARIDQPLDWKSLWVSFRQRLEGLATDAALRAATDGTDVELRRSQGAYQAYLDARAAMDEMVTQARGGRSVEEATRGSVPEPWKRSS